MKYIFAFFGSLIALLAAPEGEALKVYLQHKTFVDAPAGNYHELKFEGDKIETQTFGPGGVPCSARFSVSGKVLRVKNPGSVSGDGCALHTDKCTFLETPDSPLSVEALQCENSLFFNMDKPAPLGKEIRLDGAAAITLKPGPNELTTAAVFRKKPAKSGAAIQCTYYNAEMNGNPKTGLPPGFTVYARTKDKVKVDKWENYWYYVFSPSYDTQTCNSQFGWVFGEFVRPRRK